MAWLGSFPGYNSFSSSGMNVSSDGAVRMFSGCGQMMDIKPDGSMRMYNNGQSMNISSGGYLSMNNNGQRMNIYPDGTVSMHNNGQYMNVSSGGFASRHTNRPANRTDRNMFLSNYGNGQYVSSYTSGQYARNYPNSTGNWQSSHTVNFGNPAITPSTTSRTSTWMEANPFLDRNSTQEAAERDAPNTGLSITDMEKIPVFWAQVEKEESCEICLDDVVIGEEIRILPCCHQFHRQCVDPWLRKSATCPTCRITVTA